MFFFFKQMPAYEVRISDWISDVCSSDLALSLQPQLQSLSWYLIYLISLGLFLLRYGAFFDGLWVALPLLLWPAIAGLSYFWSDAPGQTLRTAIQLGMTVLISAYFGARFSLFDIARALIVEIGRAHV